MSNIKISSQYVKDLSFEVPNAPDIFLIPALKPDIALSIDIDAKKLSLNAFEVSLKIKAEAKTKEQDKVIFICEVSYAGIFTLDEKIQDQKEIEAILLIYCPSILFPFARRVVASCTIDGGFPPLMLEPINFAELYEKRSGK